MTQSELYIHCKEILDSGLSTPNQVFLARECTKLLKTIDMGGGLCGHPVRVTYCKECEESKKLMEVINENSS